jgi:hypothetical protein
MMETVTPEDRPDAPSAISLIELLAPVSTVSLFGATFAYLSELGKSNLVFILNAVGGQRHRDPDVTSLTPGLL